MTWHEDPANALQVERLQDLVADRGRLLVFLSAGLSFGAARLNSRAGFDYGRHDRRPPWWPDEPRLVPDDVGLPLPSWPWLVSRMYEGLFLSSTTADRQALLEFFIEEGPLDCAQLYRQTVGEANYREFLLRQFDGGRQGFVQPTPSHEALRRLGLPLLFTTPRASRSNRSGIKPVTVQPPANRPRRHLVVESPRTMRADALVYSHPRNGGLLRDRSGTYWATTVHRQQLSNWPSEYSAASPNGSQRVNRRRLSQAW